MTANRAKLYIKALIYSGLKYDLTM